MTTALWRACENCRAIIYQPRLTLELVQSRETVEAELSRPELTALGLGLNDIVRVRLRQVLLLDLVAHRIGAGIGVVGRMIPVDAGEGRAHRRRIPETIHAA